jgi:hypothetical protein
MMMYRESGGRNPDILYIGTKWKLVISFLCPCVVTECLLFGFKLKVLSTKRVMFCSIIFVYSYAIENVSRNFV